MTSGDAVMDDPCGNDLARHGAGNSVPAALHDFWRARGAPSRLLIAVSGGSDSIALMMASAALKAAGASISVATVDHGLRAAARDEAQWVAARARERGLPHAILTWTGDKPATGLQAAARAARYRLLARHGAAIGADAIMTGHTADDQAETLLMRLARGSGLHGLAAMRDDSAIADGAGAPVRLMRPFLTRTRAELRACLTAAGADFIDDPSNDDAAFERVRWRAHLAAIDPDLGLTVSSLARAAARLSASAAREVARENALFARYGVFYHWGGASLQRRAADDPAAPGLAARLIHAVGGAPYAPDADSAANSLDAALSTGRATRAGAMVMLSGAELWFFREPAGLLGGATRPAKAPERVPPGGQRLWDRRFVITNQGPETLRVEALGHPVPGQGADDRPCLSGGASAASNGAPEIAMRTVPVCRMDRQTDEDQTDKGQTGEDRADHGVSPANGPVSFMKSLLEERFYGRVHRF